MAGSFFFCGQKKLRGVTLPGACEVYPVLWNNLPLYYRTTTVKKDVPRDTIGRLP